MKKTKVIAIVGMPGSGKGTITDELEKKNYPVIHFGNMVYDEVNKRGLDIVADEVFVRHDMRKNEGAAVMAKRATAEADKLLSAGENVVIFDGLYSWTEYKFLSDKYGPGLYVVSVVAPKNLRYQRVLDRDDKHRQYTLDELIAREIDEIENMEKGGPIASADYYINNDGTMKEFKADIKRMCKILGI